MSRLKARLRDPEWRRFGTLIILGKISAIGLLLVVMAFVNPDLIGFRAFAADPALKGNDIVNPVNTRLDPPRGVSCLRYAGWFHDA